MTLNKSLNLSINCFLKPVVLKNLDKALKKYLAVHNGKLLREFEDLYDELYVAGYYKGVKEMKDCAKYAKIVEWSDKGQCFIGSCPGLFYGGCHGDNEQEVFAELFEIVEETIAL